MAVRGWTAPVATAIGVAAGAGAAQLGFGYGLGIIVWLPSADRAGDASWVASLTWATWIAATATITGAVIAARLAGEPVRSTGDPPAGPDTGSDAHPDTATGTDTLATGVWRIILAVAAALGALVTVALIAVPARAATRADTFSPQAIAAGYAVLGVVAGLLVAIWALTTPAVARNLIATACWIWLLAVLAVIEGVLSGRQLTALALGVWQLDSDSGSLWYRDHIYWPGLLLSFGSALVIGLLTARPRVRAGGHRVGTTVSGLAGPLLVALAYFLAAPRLVGARAEQLSAQLTAPYAVLAGLAGSVLVAALAQRAGQRRARPGSRAAGPAGAVPAGTGTTRAGDTEMPGTAGAGSDGTAPGTGSAADAPTATPVSYTSVVDDDPTGVSPDPDGDAGDPGASPGTDAGATRRGRNATGRMPRQSSRTAGRDGTTRAAPASEDPREA